MNHLQLCVIIMVLTFSNSIKSEGLAMNIETKINRIIEWREQDGSVQIVAKPSGLFVTNSKRVDPEFWDNVKGEKVNHELMDVATMESAFHEKKHVVIKFNLENRTIESTYYPIVDNISVLGDIEEGADKIMVHALKRPSLYYLKKSHKNFNYIYSVLSEANKSLKTGVKAAIAVPPGEYFIEDAVIVESSD